MMDFLAEWYLVNRALHIVAIISWMAGLLYLPRLFVYHADAEPGSVQSETFKVMERKLIRFIMNPAMIAAWLFGVLLLLTPGVADWSSIWIYVKLVGVSALTGTHHMFSLWRKRFEVDGNEKDGRFYRAVNELPTVLMITIVFMVVLKPF